MKLTAGAIAALSLPEGVSDFVWWDSEIAGFGYRLRASGVGSWIYQFRFRRQSRRMTAKASAVSASAARTWAKQAASKAALGQDPSSKSESEPGAIILGEAIDLFLDRQQARLRPRSLIEAKRDLSVHARPLHRLPLIKVDRRAVAALLAKIGSSKGPIAANNVRRDLSAFFSWCAREGLIDANPAAHTNRFPNKPREHLLTDDEIKAVWNATASDDAYCALVRLLLLLGCRRQELGLLRWEEIDFDNALISLPAERTKGGRPFVIPLPGPALSILRAQPRGEREFVFGGGARGFIGWSRGKAALDARSGTSGWRLHDLRRVISTRLHEDLLQPPHLIEAILGHHQPGVAGVYNRAQYLNERRRVLEMWAAHVEAIVEGRESKIVAFTGRLQ